jgi:hypothetical protein
MSARHDVIEDIQNKQIQSASPGPRTRKPPAGAQAPANKRTLRKRLNNGEEQAEQAGDGAY